VSIPDQIEQMIADLCESQRYAVLATQEEGRPYLSLLAFASTPDVRELIFATERDTAKYANLTADPRVAVLIDNRSNRSLDTEDGMAATAIGAAEEVSEDERGQVQRFYLAKHPHLDGFVGSHSCALVRVKVDRYVVAIGIGTVHVVHTGA
jgi:nitroimidazol reductase NimA-like FMN-containing flavoprotein (pyridoxamine 5'-phosphate oxidase superfamily)